MPTANDRPGADGGGDRRHTDEATIRAEEAHRDAETAREAMDEALKQRAVPFERARKEADDDPSPPDGPGGG